MARKRQQGPVGADSDDEDTSKNNNKKNNQNNKKNNQPAKNNQKAAKPVESKKEPAKKPSKKGQRGPADSDEEDKQPIPQKQAKQAPKKVETGSESDEVEIPQPVKKGKKAPAPKKAPNKSTPQKKEDSDNESDDQSDEIEIPQPVKKGKKTPASKKAPNKSTPQKKDESDSESDDEIEIPQPVKKGKKAPAPKKAPNKNTPQKKEESDDESDDQSDEIEIPQPVKKGKKTPASKKAPTPNKNTSQKKIESSDDEPDDQSDEIEIPQPVKKGKKTPASMKAPTPNKSTPQKKDESDNELEDDSESTENQQEQKGKQETPLKTKEEKPLKGKEDKEEEVEVETEEKRPLTKLEKNRLRKEAKNKKLGGDLDDKLQEKKEILEKVGEGSDSTSVDIHVENINISYPKRELLRDASLHLAHGHKYGLVAPNGAGKSTVLTWLAQRRDVFNSVPSHFDILHVEQEVSGGEETALESVIAADVERIKLLEEEKKLSLLCDSQEDQDPEIIERAGTRLTQIYDRLDAIEAYSAEARASQILTGLQFDEQMKAKKTKEFSGGWRMRIALARALFRKPTLLLLDEPTNHLDLFAVIWLETYLKGWKNTMLVVSHDQDFLNNVCTDILHIHECKLQPYKNMNYDNFRHLFEQRQEELKKAFEKQQKLLKQQQNVKSKKKDAVSKKQQQRIDSKVVRNKNVQTNKARTTDENDSEKKLLEKPKDYLVNFDFTEPPPLTLPVIDVSNVSFGYDPTRLLFKNLTFGIDMESRIALVGPNGTGKSTLLKLLMQEMPPTTGTINLNRKLHIGYFAQHFVDQLPMDETPVKYLMRIHSVEEKDARAMLGRFGLAGHTHLRPISSLSGGQKSRVVLSNLSHQKPNILFLDEPTNHLDMESIEALAEGLNKFTGGIVLVSHDSRLISQVCGDIWAVDPDDRSVHPFEGDFHDYRAMLVETFERRLREEEERRQQDEEQKRDNRKKERDEKFRKLEEIKMKSKKVPVMKNKNKNPTTSKSAKPKKKN